MRRDARSNRRRVVGTKCGGTTTGSGSNLAALTLTYFFFKKFGATSLLRLEAAAAVMY